MAILVVHYTLRFCVCFKLLIKIKGGFGELKGFIERIVKNSLEDPAKTHIHFLKELSQESQLRKTNAVECSLVYVHMCISREKHPRLSLAAPRGRDPNPPPHQD